MQVILDINLAKCVKRIKKEGRFICLQSHHTRLYRSSPLIMDIKSSLLWEKRSSQDVNVACGSDREGDPDYVVRWLKVKVKTVIEIKPCEKWLLKTLKNILNIRRI